jgi:hypothetical protein
MGLRISLEYSNTEVFEGSYGAFNRLRQAVARATGGSYPPHWRWDENGNIIPGIYADMEPNTWYWGEGYSHETHPGLHEFFCHSDCDGIMTPKVCAMLAEELEALLPRIEDGGGGHLERVGGYKGAVQKLIDGCKAAAQLDEHLKFR